MGKSEHSEDAQVKKSEKEVLIVGKLPADVVADIEAAEYGVPARTGVEPVPPPPQCHAGESHPRLSFNGPANNE